MRDLRDMYDLYLMILGDFAFRNQSFTSEMAVSPRGVKIDLSRFGNRLIFTVVSAALV